MSSQEAAAAQINAFVAGNVPGSNACGCNDLAISALDADSLSLLHSDDAAGGGSDDMTARMQRQLDAAFKRARTFMALPLAADSALQCRTAPSRIRRCTAKSAAKYAHDTHTAAAEAGQPTERHALLPANKHASDVAELALSDAKESASGESPMHNSLSTIPRSQASSLLATLQARMPRRHPFKQVAVHTIAQQASACLPLSAQFIGVQRLHSMRCAVGKVLADTPQLLLLLLLPIAYVILASAVGTTMCAAEQHSFHKHLLWASVALWYDLLALVVTAVLTTLVMACMAAACELACCRGAAKVKVVTGDLSKAAGLQLDGDRVRVVQPLALLPAAPEPVVEHEWPANDILGFEVRLFGVSLSPIVLVFVAVGAIMSHHGMMFF